MRVLICDDEPSVRFLFRTAVEDCGAEVVEASNGEECLVVAARAEIDVVVLDLMMPVRDGLGILLALRALCPCAEVLVVSAHGAEDAFVQGKSRGATDCFEKLAFLDRIPELFGRSRAPT